jgi:hypothetical protein
MGLHLVSCRLVALEASPTHPWQSPMLTVNWPFLLMNSWRQHHTRSANPLTAPIPPRNPTLVAPFAARRTLVPSRGSTHQKYV